MAQNKDITIKLVETSDVHGSFFPYDFINRSPKSGSMARVYTFVQGLRKEYGKDNIYLLDNGDILQGQPISYYYNYIVPQKENIAASVLNYMGYDAATVGNHDIETGHSVYDKWFKELHFPILGANIINARTNKPYILPYTVIKKKNGLKVCVIGMLTPAIPNWLKETIWSGLRFDEMVSCAKRTMEEVKKKENPDVIVGLFHSGWNGGIKTPQYDEDASQKVAQEVPGFDVIFFGHDHTPHNTIEKNINGKDVICLDPANNAQKVALATLTLKPKTIKGKRSYVLTHTSGELVDVRNISPDKDFMQHFQPEIDSVKAWSEQVIGKFANTIYTKDCFFGNSAFNDLILDLELKITHADIAFNAPLQFNSAIKAGNVTVADMFSLYKYENQLCVMRLTGEEVRKHLEMSYDLWVNTMKSPDDHLLLLANTRDDAQRLGFKNFSFNFDSAAGIDYVVDVTKPDGEKVHILRMSNGEPFDEHKWYTVAVNSYRANGGGELLTKGAGIARDSLKNRIIWESEKDQRHYLMEEIKKAGIMNPQPHNNWKFIPEAWTVPAAARDRKILFGE
jgi:5'-nucleotidase family protein